MDNESIIETILGNRSGMRVLRVLSGVKVALSVRQIAHQTRLTYPAANDALERLADAGIVFISRSGNTRLFQLVRENIYVEQVISPLFQLERGFREMIVNELRQKLASMAVSVTLFGSFARGEQTPESDVDVLVVTTDIGQKTIVEQFLLDYATGFYYRFGHSLEVLVYDYRQARELQKRAPALFAEIEEDGYVISGSIDWMHHE